MKMPLFLPKRFLGIDIGTSTIKIIELSSFVGRIKLENYGQISSKALYQKPFRTFEKSTLLLSTNEISKAIKAIFEEAKIKSKKAFFSLPDFVTFFSTFWLPQMTKEEIPFAVEAEARRHIPIPLAEVAWDWQVIARETIDKRERIKVLLVAVPKEVVNQYQLIANTLKIELLGLEAEVFSLARALTERREGVVGIIDIGARTTSCSIIEKGKLKFSHSFDLSGDDLTERIAKSLRIDYNLAEELKTKYGLVEETIPEGKQVREILLPLLDLILKEANQVFERYLKSEGKEVEKIILAGDSAKLPGFLEHSENYFRKKVEIANPFRRIYFPPILEETLKELGPSFSVAVGLALRGFE